MEKKNEFKTYIVFGLKEDGEAGEVLGVIESHHINKAIEDAQEHIDKKNYDQIKVVYNTMLQEKEKELYSNYQK